MASCWPKRRNFALNARHREQKRRICFSIEHQRSTGPDFGFTAEQNKLIDRVTALVRQRIAPRAAQYDLSFEAPIEDIRDIHREGWLLANLDKRHGGLGYGLNGDDPLSFFLIDEHLAYGNPSTAHCFQVHKNALMMIDAMAGDAQVEKWIEPTINRAAYSRRGRRTSWRPSHHGQGHKGRLSRKRHETLCNQCQSGGVALDRASRFGFASGADHVHGA